MEPDAARRRTVGFPERRRSLSSGFRVVVVGSTARRRRTARLGRVAKRQRRRSRPTPELFRHRDARRRVLGVRLSRRRRRTLNGPSGLSRVARVLLLQEESADAVQRHRQRRRRAMGTVVAVGRVVDFDLRDFGQRPQPERKGSATRVVAAGAATTFCSRVPRLPRPTARTFFFFFQNSSY